MRSVRFFDSSFLRWALICLGAMGVAVMPMAQPAGDVAGATLRGRALLNDGGTMRPLAGVMIHFGSGEQFTPILLRGDTTPTSGVLTDAEGKYEVRGVPPGALRVVAFKAGYVRAYIAPENSQELMENFGGEQIVLRPGETREGLDFTLLDETQDPYAAQAEVAGTVLTPEGKPAAGVEVQLFGCRGFVNGQPMYSKVKTTTTNQAGQYAFQVTRRQAAGVAVQPTELLPAYGFSLGAEPNAKITLTPCARIRGRVADESDAPLPKRDVRASWSAEGISPFASQAIKMRAVQSEADGTFEMGFLPAGNISLSVNNERSRMEHAGDALFSLKMKAGEVIEDVTLRTAGPKAKRSGRLENADGSPALNWRINNGKMTGPGTFEFDASASALPMRFNTDSVTFKAGRLDPEGSGEVVFKLPPLGKLRGRLQGVEGGVPKVTRLRIVRQWQPDPPMADPTICLPAGVHLRASSDVESGVFEFEGVPQGKYKLYLGDDVAQTKALAENIELAEGQTLELGSALKVTAPAAISGVALRADNGLPLMGAEYRIEAYVRAHGQTAPLPEAELDVAGNFTFAPVPTDAESVQFTAILRVVHPMRNGVSRGDRDDPKLHSGPIALNDLKPDSQNNLGQIKLRQYHLRGRLEGDSATTRIERILVQGGDANWGARGMYDALQIKIGTDGEFTVESFMPYADTIMIFPQGSLPLTISPIPVADGDGVIDLGTLSLDAGASIEGVVSMPDGTPAEGMTVYVRQEIAQETKTDRAGHYRIRG